MKLQDPRRTIEGNEWSATDNDENKDGLPAGFYVGLFFREIEGMSRFGLHRHPVTDAAPRDVCTRRNTRDATRAARGATWLPRPTERRRDEQGQKGEIVGADETETQKLDHPALGRRWTKVGSAPSRPRPPRRCRWPHVLQSRSATALVVIVGLEGWQSRETVVRLITRTQGARDQGTTAIGSSDAKRKGVHYCVATRVVQSQ